MNTNYPLPYFPRPRLLEDVLAVFSSGLTQSVTLFAPWRQGKTVFVTRELIPAAENLRWRTAYVDLWLHRDDPERALVEGLERAADRYRAVGSRLPKFESVHAKAKLALVEVGVDAKVAHSKRGDAPLTDRLQSAIDALAKHGTTLLALDEFQSLADVKREDFVAALRAVLQQHSDTVKVLYIGSSRDALNRMFNRQRAPLFRSAKSMPLPDLTRAFSADRARFLLERTGTRVDERDLDELFEERLFRTPEFLNQVIVNLLIAGNGDLEQAFSTLLGELRRDSLVNQLAELRPIHLSVLSLLGGLHPPSVYSAEGVAAIRKSVSDRHVTASRVQTAVNTLVHRGLVSPTGEPGRYEIDDRALLVHLHEQSRAGIEHPSGGA